MMPSNTHIESLDSMPVTKVIYMIQLHQLLYKLQYSVIVCKRILRLYHGILLNVYL